MKIKTRIETTPDKLLPGDFLPYWGNRIVKSLVIGEFGNIVIWAEDRPPLALHKTLKVTAIRGIHESKPV